MPGTTAGVVVRPRAGRLRGGSTKGSAAVESPRDARQDAGLVRAVQVPSDAEGADVKVGGKTVHLSNLRKQFWPELGITKGELLQYYADVSPVLLPHLKQRAMVMKR